MATSTERTPRESLLGHLEQKSWSILDLLKTMEAEGFSDSEVKEQVARLLHEHQIELTADRRLKIPIAA